MSHIESRNGYIDILRAFALLCLVIAHTWAPVWLTIVRSFDVPLMVFLSALCYKASSSDYWSYVKHRFIRIYKPVAIFLLIFFLITFIGSFVIPDLKFGLDKILGSFLLLNSPSIGYVWIMRVFLMVALVLPLVYSKINRLNVLGTSVLIVILYAAVELTNKGIGLISNYPFITFIIQEYIGYILAYGIIIILGIKSKNAENKDLIIYISLIVLLYLMQSLFDKTFCFNPTLTKYPPHSIYILYGTLVCLILWMLRPKHKIEAGKICSYLSKNSMWLYLWHIIPVYALIPFKSIPNTWFLRYCVVIVGMLILNFFFEKIFSKLKNIINRWIS